MTGFARAFIVFYVRGSGPHSQLFFIGLNHTVHGLNGNGVEGEVSRLRLHQRHGHAIGNDDVFLAVHQFLSLVVLGCFRSRGAVRNGDLVGSRACGVRVVARDGGGDGGLADSTGEVHITILVHRGHVLIAGGDGHQRLINDAFTDERGEDKVLSASVGIEVEFNFGHRLLISIDKRQGLGGKFGAAHTVILLHGHIQGDVHEVTGLERQRSGRRVLLLEDILVGIDLDLGELDLAGHAHEVGVEGGGALLPFGEEEGEFLVALVTVERFDGIVLEVHLVIGHVTGDVVGGGDLDLAYRLTFQVGDGQTGEGHGTEEVEGNLLLVERLGVSIAVVAHQEVGLGVDQGFFVRILHGRDHVLVPFAGGHDGRVVELGRGSLGLGHHGRVHNHRCVVELGCETGLGHVPVDGGFHVNLGGLHHIGTTGSGFCLEDMDVFDIRVSPVRNDLEVQGGLGLRGGRGLRVEDDGVCLFLGLHEVGLLIAAGGEP